MVLDFSLGGVRPDMENAGTSPRVDDFMVRCLPGSGVEEPGAWKDWNEEY
jgi:hypothetical protein